MVSQPVVYAPAPPLPPTKDYKYPQAPKDFFLVAQWAASSVTKVPLAIAGNVSVIEGV